MRVSESDDELDADYDMLDSDLDEDELKKFANASDSPASTAPSTPFLNPSGKLPRSRQKIHKCTFEDCDRVFDRKARLDDHLRSHNNERNFTCPHPLCTKTFLRDSHLKHHIKNQHSEVRDYECEWEGCDASFTTGTRLRRHIATHEAREQFRCRGYSGCDQTFRKQETLDRHILTVHQGVKAFPCRELDSTTGAPCNKAYDTAENLRTHVRAKHDMTRFSCDECMALNEALLLSPEDQGDKQVRPAQFATYALLQAHNAEYHPPTCQFCPTSFVTAKELTRHLELQHGILPEKKTTNASVFTCTFEGCGKKFTKRGNLNVHVKTVHENKRDFVCGKTLVPLPADAIDRGQVIVHGCGRGFTSRASLEEHVRTAHLELPSKRMIRENKRKAGIVTFEEDSQPKKQKQRKARSDKGVPRGSAMNGLTGIGEPATPILEDGPFPFGFGDDIFTQIEMNDQVLPRIGTATRLRSDTGDSMDGSNGTILSASMTICGDEIYSQGTAYHYPSGEYPTLLSRDLARTTVRDEDDALEGRICTSPSRNFGMNPIDDYDDVNFFGHFEQENKEVELAYGKPRYVYPAL